MTSANNSSAETTKWQQLYTSSESRWKDLERTVLFLATIIGLTFLVSIYVATGHEFLYMEDWAPQDPAQFSFMLYEIQIAFVFLAPLIVIGWGMFFIFKQAGAFVRSFYQPAEDEKLGPLIQRRLMGVLPMPPPLDTVFKYPFVLIKESTSLAETHWTRWFGGPATLVIYDGVAVYLERGNKFSRVAGPGAPMPFLERYERIREVVDLRPQTKTGNIKPWTKDGIRIELTIRADCQINSSLEASTHSTKFRFPFDPLAVKTAVERYTVRATPSGELFEASWMDGAWGTITGAINAFVGGHSIDELFFSAQMDRNTNAGMLESDSTHEDIEQILSHKLREELEKTKKGLALNGVRVLSIQITGVEVPKEVQELRRKYWESARQKIAAIRNSRAEADRIRIREQAHAEAQRTMLNTITQRLERVDPKNLTEPLILSLSGILDQGLDDPIVRPLIAKESFAVLDRVRKMLNDGF